MLNFSGVRQSLERAPVVKVVGLSRNLFQPEDAFLHHTQAHALGPSLAVAELVFVLPGLR